jgi:RND family efflux transporter MFP subunit
VGTHRKAALAIGAGVVLFAVLAAWGAPRLLNPEPAVTLYTVTTQPVTTFVAGGGLTFPVQQMNIVYPVPAGVLKVTVQVGQSVTKGQLLLTLNNANLQAQLQQARAAVEAAQTVLNGVYNTPGASAAAVAAAQSTLLQAEGNYNSLAQEINSPVYSNGNILSPFAGVVTAVNATPNTVVNSGTVLVSVADLSTIIAKVQFPLDQRSLISLNQTADVYSAAAPDQHFVGTVTTINPVLTSAGADTFEAWVTVANSTNALFSGESVYARVKTQATMPTVPELAVVNPDADSVVFVYSNGRAHLQHVVVGIRDGSRFGISSGLTDGEQVILVGQYQLSDNEKVKVRGTQSP